MPMAGHAGGVLDAVRRPPPIARARQHGCKLALDQLFDERPHPIAHRALNRIEPTVEKMFVRGGLRLQSRRTNAIAERFNAKQFEVHHPGDYATSIPTTPRRDH